MLDNIKERLLINKINEEENEIKTAVIVFGILIIALFFGMFYLFITTNKAPIYLNQTSQQISPAVSASPTPCIDCITPTPTITPSKKSSIPVVQESNVKEYFVPFGSGSGQAVDWADVVGLTANVDLGGYQNIKEIRFEVSINVLTANQIVSVRLFNNTDKHPVWNSEVTMSGGASYLVSSPIIYDNGSKLYQVQLKTQLGYPANISQSRLHIILK
ncbi:MAG: hypothetical protein AAB521_04425 [Patescibacteria group bacterium]